MKSFIAPILFILAFACSKSDDNASQIQPDANSELVTKEITVDSRLRTYLLYKPKGYNNAGKLPVVFANHGGGGSSSGMMTLADFRSIADREKFLLIYPQGYGNSWNDGRPTTANIDGVDDVNFFRQMCNSVVANENADATRIYVTGMSNGGFMSARLACELSDKIAAFATIGASMEQGIYNNCNPTNPVPSIFIHGTYDTFVPFLGGTVSPGAGGTAVSHANAVLKWIGINGCSATPATTALPDTAMDTTIITERIYTNASTSRQVVSYVIQNGGHTWPQGFQYQSVAIIGITSQNMNANEKIWEFFKKFKRN